jgi:hypothetical protein
MVHVPEQVGAAVLSELDAVAWDSLGHAYGLGSRRREGINPFTKQAIAILQPGPRQILEAVAHSGGDPDDDTRMDALDGLYSTITHQGTIYEVTSHFVPYAAAIAADPKHGARRPILQWLLMVFALASGSPDALLAQRVFAALRASVRVLARAAEAGDPVERRLFRWLVDALALDPSPARADEADRLAAELEVS